MRWQEAYRDALAGLQPIRTEVAPNVSVVLGDDVQACRDPLKPELALYLGGMGARGRNFYNDLASRYGFEEAAARIKDRYLAGRKRDAIAEVPDALVDEVALVGPAARVAERLELWRDSPATTLIARSDDLAALEVLAAANG